MYRALAPYWKSGESELFREVALIENVLGAVCTSANVMAGSATALCRARLGVAKSRSAVLVLSSLGPGFSLVRLSASPSDAAPCCVNGDVLSRGLA